MNEIDFKDLRICVLLPDYSTTDVDYQHYDPPRNLSTLLPEAHLDHIFLNKLTTYKQLREASKKNYDVYINLCEGYLDWSVPSIDVIHTLELLELPYTGPNVLLYDPTKELMKYVAYTQGIKTPGYKVISNIEQINEPVAPLEFPVFIKPAKAGDSLGIDQDSLCRDEVSKKKKCLAVFDEYAPLLVEEYIEGREFTVLVLRKPDNSIEAFDPVEYLFPKSFAFKTYALKTSALHPDSNVRVTDELLSESLKRSAIKIFSGFGGVGYARLDFRSNKNNDLFFLEINFTCSVFYTDGYEGSADFILKASGVSSRDFLKGIIKEGMSRHQQKMKVYKMSGDSVSGYGIYANRNIRCGEVVYRGEERAHRIATKSHIDTCWGLEAKENFMKYAYPASRHIYLLWDESPAEWAPQNHCCDANTGYVGLNVIAKRDIEKGEELTLDYGEFLDDTMQPFQCSCRKPNCRGVISGIKNNHIDFRESLKTI
jgi:D-alanine-D-alanine ligase